MSADFEIEFGENDEAHDMRRVRDATPLRAPRRATVTESGPSPTGYVAVSISAPTEADARAACAAYRERWLVYDAFLHTPVCGTDGVWRASGHRWDRC